MAINLYLQMQGVSGVIPETAMGKNKMFRDSAQPGGKNQEPQFDEAKLLKAMCEGTDAEGKSIEEQREALNEFLRDMYLTSQALLRIVGETKKGQKNYIKCFRATNRGLPGFDYDKSPDKDAGRHVADQIAMAAMDEGVEMRTQHRPMSGFTRGVHRGYTGAPTPTEFLYKVPVEAVLGGIECGLSSDFPWEREDMVMGGSEMEGALTGYKMATSDTKRPDGSTVWKGTQIGKAAKSAKSAGPWSGSTKLKPFKP